MSAQRSGFFERSSDFTISEGTFNDSSGDINQYYGTQRVAGLNYGPTFILNYQTPQGPTLKSSNSRPTSMDGIEWMPGGGHGSQRYVGRGSSTHSMSGSQVSRVSLANKDPVGHEAGWPYDEEASSGVLRRVPSDGGGSDRRSSNYSQYSGVRYDSHRSESSRRSWDRAHSNISVSEPGRLGMDYGYNVQAPRRGSGASHSGPESHSSIPCMRHRSHSRHRSNYSQDSDRRHATHRSESSWRSCDYNREHSDRFESEASTDYRRYNVQPPRRDSGASRSTSGRESVNSVYSSQHSSHSRHSSCSACPSRPQYPHDSQNAYDQSSAIHSTRRNDGYYESSMVDEDAGRPGVRVWNFPTATVWSIPRGHVVILI
ncbi:hypothetical protein C8F04DRAFT_1060560 [Mycena alexandri]|uniref:Uncharacterized protein n=1 Tax=Mycena alexandri TaxID=1745969 RepID=A0AAD6TMA6_9AGAR|nr:hypothetical protein C8F04DRAFT_1060560 [Mycena alexandri]